MHLHVLGTVEASADGRPVSLGGPKPRALLVMLGLEANRTLTADQLIEGLWGERPPASASKLIQTYVWRLRTALGEDAGAQIVTRGRGYELRIDPECVDARRFERLLAVANRADEAGEPLDAAREALNLWRGPALADLADEPFAAAEIRRLEELRMQATELAIAADLAAGRHREAAAEIDVVIAEHPLRERPHAQRMLALYRCGRQADALEAYRQARRMLVDQIGVEPGRELQRLHERQPPPPDRPAHRPCRRTRLQRRDPPPTRPRARRLVRRQAPPDRRRQRTRQPAGPHPHPRTGHAHGIGYQQYTRAHAEVLVDSITYCVLGSVGLDVSGQSIPYIAGWGEDGALDAIREYAQTIDTIARRIEDALHPKPEPADDAVAVEAIAA